MAVRGHQLLVALFTPLVSSAEVPPTISCTKTRVELAS